MMRSLTSYILDLNLFQSTTENVSEINEVKRLDLISTRIYAIAMILAVIILGFAMWFTPSTTILIYQNPTQTQFEASPNDTFCPCSYAAPTYGDFIALEPEFHQVCDSDLVTDRWIKTIFSGSNATFFLPYDFRSQGSALFLSLAKFCHLAKRNVFQEMLSFQTFSLISPQALSKVVLENQVQSAFDQFQLRIPEEFNAQLRLLREIIVSNQFVSALHTSIRPMFNQISQTSAIRTFMQYVIYEGRMSCECHKNIECQVKIPLAIIDVLGATEDEFSYLNDAEISMIIPGLRAACTPVDSLLGSSLECFYNQNCINQLLTFFNTDEKFWAMNQSSVSQFQVNATVQSLINYLFVEKWTLNISYENYFSQCAPAFCTYSTSQRRSGTFVSTKLISILSILTVLLRLLVSTIVRLIFKKKNIYLNEQIARKYRKIVSQPHRFSLLSFVTMKESCLKKSVMQYLDAYSNILENVRVDVDCKIQLSRIPLM